MVTKSIQPALLPAYIEGDNADYDAYDAYDIYDSHDEIDELCYGFRYVHRIINGKDALVRVPLTLDDIMHPIEDDFVNQCLAHVLICTELFYILSDWLKNRPDLLVLYDSLTYLGSDEDRSYGPDIIVLRDVHTIPKHGAYKPSKHGGKPVLIVEVTSRSTRHVDISPSDPKRSKYLHYQRLGIPYYLVIDEAHSKGNQAPEIWGYILRHGFYSHVTPDRLGRFWIPPIQVSLGPYDTGVAWYNPQGKRILAYTEQREQTEQERARVKKERARVKQERTRAEEAEARAEQERACAEQERSRAEQERARADALEQELKRLKAQAGETE